MMTAIFSFSHTMFSLPIVKRKLTIMILALVLATVDTAMSADLMKEMSHEFWNTPLMWATYAHYLLIAIAVMIMGVFTIHPVFKWRLYPVVRGAIIGAFFSLVSAVYSLMINHPLFEKHFEAPNEMFWAVVIHGAVLGLILDICGTKFGGEGKDLLKTL